MATQVTTQTIPADVLWNEGEGIETSELNRTGRRALRQFLEYFVRPTLIKVRNAGSSAVAPFRNALAVSVASGMVIEVAGGLVFHEFTDADDPVPAPWPAGDRSDAALLAYRKDAVTQFTVDAADPTNPRWDIVSAKIERITDPATVTLDFQDSGGNQTSQAFNARRLYRLTMTYTPGAPAGSPAEPAVPAGEVKIARIVVPALAASLTNDANIIDFRQPAGYMRHTPRHAMMDGMWTQDSTGKWSKSVVGTGTLTVPITPPVQGVADAAYQHETPAARLGYIRFTYKLRAGATVKLRRRHITPTSYVSLVEDVEDFTSLITADNTNRTIVVGPTLPAWAHGHPHAVFDGQRSYLVLAVVNGSNGDTDEVVYSVDSFFWGG